MKKTVLYLSLLMWFIFLFQQSLAQQRKYVCNYTKESVYVDGQNDAAWNIAQWIPDFVNISGQALSSSAPSTRVKMIWNDTTLFVFAVLEEKHIWATITDPNMAVFAENAFEIFIDPNGDGLDYFEIQVNALGTCWKTQLSAPYREGGKPNPTWLGESIQVKVITRGTVNNSTDIDLAWVVELVIPFSELGVSKPQRGDSWRLNFARVQWEIAPIDDQNGYMKQYQPGSNTVLPAHYYVWSPHQRRDMHIPRKFGVVDFQ